MNDRRTHATRARDRASMALLFAGATLAVPGIAAAQQGAKPAGAGLEEVVVTARKAEEKLTEIPLAIAAFTQEDLIKRNSTSLYDVAQYTAGFSFENYAGATTPAPLIRGLTQNALTDRNQNVGTFVDGVHVQNQGNIDFSMLDLERIEIVKGPQNAQYGRSSFAGAINWVPKRPNLQKWEGYVTGTVGTDERRDIQGSLSIPLWQDKLAVRIAGISTEFDGTFRNNFPGSTKAVRTTILNYSFRGTDGNLGGYDNHALQASVRFRPVDALTLDLMYYRSVAYNEAGANVTIQPRPSTAIPGQPSFMPNNCAPTLAPRPGYTGPYNQLWCGELKLSRDEVLVDPRGVGAQTHSDLATGRLEYRFSDNLAATYVYGRGLYDAANFGPTRNQAPILVNGDATLPRQPGTNRTGLQFASNPFTNQESTSNEFRLDGKVGEIKWRLGVYSSRVEDLGATSLIEYRLPLGVDPTGAQSWGQFPFSFALATYKDKSNAEFGSISIPFADTWTVEAEARHAREKRTQLPLNRSRTFSEFTPRVNLKWQPQPGWMFYGSVAKGVKAGGFNGPTADVAIFEPEKNMTYELGAKQALLNNTLQLNYAVFFINWDDLQLSVPDLIPTPPSTQDANYVGNVKGATSKGVELEAIWAPTDNWRFNFAGSFVKSQFKDGTVDTTFGRLCESSAPPCVFLPRSAAFPQGGSPIGGNDLPRTPKSKASIGAEYRMPVLGQWELSIRGDFNYQSKYYAENLNLAYVPSRQLVNANISLTDPDGRWYASIWGKNLTDELYASSAFAVAVVNQYGPGLGQGRTAGLTVRYNFK